MVPRPRTPAEIPPAAAQPLPKPVGAQAAPQQKPVETSANHQQQTANGVDYTEISPTKTQALMQVTRLRGEQLRRPVAEQRAVDLVGSAGKSPVGARKEKTEKTASNKSASALAKALEKAGSGYETVLYLFLGNFNEF